MNSTIDNTTCMFRNSEPNVVTFIGDTMITTELTEFNAGTVLVILCLYDVVINIIYNQASTDHNTNIVSLAARD